MKYFDSKSPRPWRSSNRVKLIGQIEGTEQEDIIKEKISQACQSFINRGIYVALKFNNDNKTQFYFRAEWLNIDGQNTTIKKGYELTDEDFEGKPEHKRRNFKWILPEE
ncbi:MAG: hypothetical protein M3Q58_14060 [Bacteroidota bacterium]|nr:hypothetical protein [Bacteroidota bacterium]